MTFRALTTSLGPFSDPSRGAAAVSTVGRRRWTVRHECLLQGTRTRPDGTAQHACEGLGEAYGTRALY